MVTAIIRSSFDYPLMTDEHVLKCLMLLTTNCIHKVRNSQAQSVFSKQGHNGNNAEVNSLSVILAVKRKCIYSGLEKWL